jgi:phage shock protein E
MPTVTPEALAAQIADGTAPFILDVRSRAEFEAGHVPGAVHIPFQHIGREIARVTAAPHEPVVVYCGHGPRAWMAGALLRRHGYTQVQYLRGHWAAWTSARLL